MKKNLWIFGAAALLSLAACSKDTAILDDSGLQAPDTETRGDLYMKMSITQLSATRTATPDQGVEIGKDRENKVTDALIVFVRPDNSIFKAMHVGATDIVGASSPYSATFEMSRAALLADIEANGTGADDKEVAYNVFVIGNPTTAMVSHFTAATAPAQVQDLFELAADGDTYWQDNRFLMSNSELATKKIKASDIPAGTHTTAATALNLGSVKIQRAMSRFDIDTDDTNIKFTASSEKNPIKDITISFDGVSLVNQATKANLFKVTSEYEDGQAQLATEYQAYTAGVTLSFNTETALNYVFSPVQTNFTLSLFGTGAATEGKITGTPNAFTSLTYTTIASIKAGEEDNTYTHPGSTVPNDLGAYHIWRYCMENTNFDKDNQVHGNTTGVVFRAKMESTTITSDGGEGIALYSFNNVIFGKAETLRDYVINEKPGSEGEPLYDVYEMVGIRYRAAIADYNAKPENKEAQITDESLKTADAETLAKLDTYLVANDFSIYRPDAEGNYYCYYTYWNRHNNNGQNTIMGPMEFATVRNNVYKLKVSKINNLGHPGNPDDDPDPEDPGTPDEEDHLYLNVDCEILPWEVRINDIEF